MNKSLAALLGTACLLGTIQARAQSIASYDITNAEASGYGQWGHLYTGAITPAAGGLFNYSGGGGTLNDGIFSDDYTNTQLFFVPDHSTITLHLGSSTTVGAINIYGGDWGADNFIPGALNQVTVTIGGVSAVIHTTPFGPTCQTEQCNDRISLAGTALAGAATDTITLSNFQTGTPGYSWYSASEVTVTAGGAVNPVPEPAAYAMLLGGLCLVGATARRQRRG